MHPALSNPPSNYIKGEFVSIEGDDLISHNPARPDEVVWHGSPRVDHVDQAVRAARDAFDAWSATSWDERVDLLKNWQAVTKKHAGRMADLITAEMGKTLAESKFEAGALAGKVDITLDEHSQGRVKEYTVAVNDSRDGRCRYKPHGVMAVIGPFNFPAHLPNGHFVPALLMGNTIVFKPSDKTPGVGQLMAEFMHEVGLPPGVFNVVQGAVDVASSLVAHDDLNGILFTGSWPVGRRILEANLDHPGRIIALEMGGNNPAVIMPSAHLKQAVVECVRASFATTGQRCTCTRRIIVHRDVSKKFIAAFCKAASTLLVGPGDSGDSGDSGEPIFMGPLATAESVDAVLSFQSKLASRGGRVLVEARGTPTLREGRETHHSESGGTGYGHFITPGVVEVDSFEIEHDCEVFGPLVQIATVDSLDEAILQANATRFGLAASIFTNDDAEWERFFRQCNAGCINHNTGTAGASGKLPFGGLGWSGNHRPAGAFSAEYCAYPVANMIERSDGVAVPAGMQWDDAWVS